MDRGVKANAMWALHIVAPIGAMVGRATSQGAVTTGGVVKEVGWAEEEVKCEGGGIIGGGVEAEALRGRYTLYPRGGPRGTVPSRRRQRPMGEGVERDVSASRNPGLGYPYEY